MYSLCFKLYTNYTQTLHWNYTQNLTLQLHTTIKPQLYAKQKTTPTRSKSYTKPYILFRTRSARNVQKLNEWMKDKNRKNPLRLMQTALTSLWCCAGWKIPSKLRIFSLPHHPLVGLHPSQGDKQKKTGSGRNCILSVNSSSAKPQRLSRSKAE